MKMVVAFINPFKLDDVRDALIAAGIGGMTVTQVSGFGRQKGQSDMNGGQNGIASFLPKVKIEVGVKNDLADKAVKAIADAAASGQVGDGKIFVYDLTQVLRIRTGEQDEQAL